MLEYNISINTPNAAFGTTGKTITVNEAPRAISQDFLAEEMHHANELIPKRTIKEVLAIFSEVAARLMAEGFALQFTADGDVALRCYADMHINGGNINLKRARELTGNAQLTEDEMVAQAGDLVQKAGISIRAYAEVEQKFTDMLLACNPTTHKAGTVERDYNSTATDTTGDDDDNNGVVEG